MNAPRKRARQRGAALVEFAFALPFLLILSFVVIEFGRALVAYDMLTRSVRDAARYLSMRTPGTGMTEARKLVVYGKTSADEAGDVAVLPGLSLAHVPEPTWQPAGSAPAIVTVSIRVTGYSFTPMIASAFGLTLGPIPFNDIVATMRSEP